MSSKNILKGRYFVIKFTSFMIPLKRIFIFSYLKYMVL